ncbi:hypothetical protein [Kingella oralis]|uniref:hypothetical protein n=1 Tax=Kingella oralis TaxID=505 RepID=UPI0034E591E7
MTPVTLYQSTDTDAPQLANAQGSLKTLLKACLVTGYGDKQPLGWAMPFEEDNKAVFKPTDPKSTQPCLLVDNSQTRFATLQPYQKMTAINQGTGLFGLGAVGFSSLDKFGYFNNQANPKWWLIGHSRAFILMIKLDSYDVSQIFYFGDVQGLGSNKTALYMTNSSGYDYLTSSNKFYSLQNSSGNGGVLSRSISNNNPIDSRLLMNTDLSSYRPVYPDPVTSGLVADAVHVVESQPNQYVAVATLTGMLGVLNDMSKVTEGTQIELDGDNDVWLKFSSAVNQHFLINATQW